ncbi:MAG: hypothetical protein ABFD92_21725 [Planctomycetaceae bacterium]
MKRFRQWWRGCYKRLRVWKNLRRYGTRSKFIHNEHLTAFANDLGYERRAGTTVEQGPLALKRRAYPVGVKDSWHHRSIKHNIRATMRGLDERYAAHAWKQPLFRRLEVMEDETTGEVLLVEYTNY